jgi:hypothetical protein
MANVDRSFYLAYEIQVNLHQLPLEIICRLTNSNYEWLNELSLYCSNLQFEIIDLFLYKNIRSYIDKSLFLNNLNFLVGIICYFIKMIYHSRRIT